MNVSKKLGSLMLALVVTAVGVSAVAADKHDASSGFLDAKVEGKLKEARLKDGRHVDRWESRGFSGK
jgi:hypothetical protein